MPASLLPLIEWQYWFHQKQKDATLLLGDKWEVVYCAGNGCGKTVWLYHNLICMALGIHPTFPVTPPVAIKVLVTDFEHGYGKIFTETVLKKQAMPAGYWVTYDNELGHRRQFFGVHQEENALEFMDTKRGSSLIETDTSYLDPMLPQEFIEKLPSRDDRSLYLPNGSFLFFQTSEQKKRLHSGTNFDVLGNDEEPEYQTYDESKRGLRTAKLGGRILHSFTPPFDEESKNKGPTWTKFKLIDPFEAGENPDIGVVRAAMADNPAITPAYIDKFSRGKTTEQLNIQLYGEYPIWGKLIFPEFEDRIWCPKDKSGHLLPWDTEVPWNDRDVLFECAIDWHGSKPCAAVWSFEYLTGPNKGDVVFFDEISPEAGKNLTISQVKTLLREMEGWRDLKIVRWGDPKMKDKNNALISGFNAWDEFRQGDPRIILNEGNNRDPYTGYSIMRDFLRGKSRGNLEHPRIFITENCRTLRHNMKNHYNKVKADGTSVPDSKFNDYCVSARYIIQNKSRKIKKAMRRKRKGYDNRWPMTSYGNFDGTYIDKGAYGGR